MTREVLDVAVCPADSSILHITNPLNNYLPPCCRTPGNYPHYIVFPDLPNIVPLISTRVLCLVLNPTSPGAL